MRRWERRRLEIAACFEERGEIAEAFALLRASKFFDGEKAVIDECIAILHERSRIATRELGDVEREGVVCPRVRAGLVTPQEDRS